MNRHELQQEILQAVLSPDTSMARLKTTSDVLAGRNTAEDLSSESGFLDDVAARRYAGNVSRTQLWKWRQDGLRFFKVGGRIFYRCKDIDAFIESTDDKEHAV